MNSPLLNTLVIVLLLLASASSFFGKNLPRHIWWISIISAVLLGFVLGTIIAPFPDSLCISSIASLGAVLLVIIFRLPRRNQPR